MSRHHIRGSEAFAYSDRRFTPGFGSMSAFSGPRLHRFRTLRQAWPLLFPLAAVVGAAIGHNL